MTICVRNPKHQRGDRPTHAKLETVVIGIPGIGYRQDAAQRRVRPENAGIKWNPKPWGTITSNIHVHPTGLPKSDDSPSVWIHGRPTPELELTSAAGTV